MVLMSSGHIVMLAQLGVYADRDSVQILKDFRVIVLNDFEQTSVIRSNDTIEDQTQPDPKHDQQPLRLILRNWMGHCRRMGWREQ